MRDELARALAAMASAEENIGKLETLWGRAQRPTVDYEYIRRSWDELLAGLPPINGWHVPSLPATPDTAVPPALIAEYKTRLEAERQERIGEELRSLVDTLEAGISEILVGLPPRVYVGDELSDESLQVHNEPVEVPGVEVVRQAWSSIEELVPAGDRKARNWSDIGRHLSFSQHVDWWDISGSDWPSIKPDVLRVASRAATTPVPVAVEDLGRGLPPSVPTTLRWDALTPEQFEELLEELLHRLGARDVARPMRTNAADAGRDISFQRSLQDTLGGHRTERVVLQAKHLLAGSVSAADCEATLAGVKTYVPRFDCVVMATSSSFSQTALRWIENHNQNERIRFEMWNRSVIERHLAQHSELVRRYRLR